MNLIKKQISKELLYHVYIKTNLKNIIYKKIIKMK